MKMINQIRVCIAENHAIVRAGLKVLLASQSEIKIVGEAVNRKTAFEIAKQQRPNLFLMDLDLGGESAVDFLAELLRACEAKAILVTGVANEEQVHSAIQAGATGVVYTDEDPEILIRAIKKVHAGEAWLSRSLTASALAQLRTACAQKTELDPESAKIASLTAREREIVALLASGIDRKKIAERLFVSEATVRNHLTSIFGKLGLSSQFDLVFFAQRHGLDKPSAAPQMSAS